jgi:DNA-binding NarL/FixJ family response regulator
MRILLADDESNVRFALRVLLEPRPGLCIAGEAGDVEGLLAEIEASCPDLVLLDWELPGMAALDPSAGSGQSLLFSLRTACPDLHVIALSGRPEARQAALEAGADAFVGKTDQPERLLAAIRSVKRTKAARILEEKQG